MSTTSAPRPHGRPCTVCAHSHRDDVEQLLVEGRPFSRISAQSGLSRDALRRHLSSGHLAPALDAIAAARYGIDTQTVAARVLDIARRAREVAIEAADAGALNTVLKAGQAETAALSALTQLGVEHEDAVEEARAFRLAGRAAFAIAQRDPAIAAVFAKELGRVGFEQLAEELRQVHEFQGELTP